MTYPSRRTLFGITLLLWGATLLRVSSLLAQSPPESIRGQVLTPTGESVALATVALEGTNFYTTADDDGYFSLVAPPGSYTVRIRRVGLQEIRRQVTVATGADLELTDLVMNPDEEMDEVMVLGKSMVQEVKEQGFQVNALNLKVQQSTTADLNQVLNQTTGVRIREAGGLGSDFTFSLNGFSGNQVKFFLNGVPMDNFGSSLTLNNLPANIAERIKVYKGVLPVSLGADALGGAVNVVTRTNPNYLDASYSIGSFNTHRPALSAAYTSDRSGFTARINAFYNYSDNDYEVLVPVRNLETNRVEGEEWLSRFHDRYQSATVWVEAGLVDQPWADQLLLGLIASGNDQDIQTGVVMEEVYGAITSNSQTLVPSLRYQKDDVLLSGLDLRLYGAYNVNDFQLVDTTARIYNWRGVFAPDPSASGAGVGGERGRTRNQNNNREWLATTNLNYTLNNWQSLAINYTLTDFYRSSFDVENPEAPGNRFPSHLTKHVVGLGWNLNIPDQWNAAVFAKLYAMEAVGYETVGSFTGDEREESVFFRYRQPGYGLASTYFLSNAWQVKASYEYAYRLPDSDEIFGDGIFVVYNPDLRPERSHNVNLGVLYRKRFSEQHHLRGEVGGIYRMTDDFIQLDQSISGGNRRTLNRGRVQTTGLEAEVKYTYGSSFLASLNGTYQRITDQQEYQETTGFTGGRTRNITYTFRLPNIPYLFANANVGYYLPLREAQWGTVLFNYTLNFVEKYYLVFAELGTPANNERYVIPSQWAHHVSATYSSHDERYNLTLECRNVTNKLLYDAYRLQKPGRAVSLKLRYFIH